MQQANTATTPKEKVARALCVVLVARLKSNLSSRILKTGGSYYPFRWSIFVKNCDSTFGAFAFLPLVKRKCENIVQ